MKLEEAEADRIIGGLVRIDNVAAAPRKYLNRALKLANNDNEMQFVWFQIGIKVGSLGRNVVVVAPPEYTPQQKPDDPAVG